VSAGGTVMNAETSDFKFFFSSMYRILSSALGPVVHLPSSRNEYRKKKNNVSG
jgi:hypothetical protein